MVIEGCGKWLPKDTGSTLGIDDSTESFFYQPENGSKEIFLQPLREFTRDMKGLFCGYTADWCNYPAWALCRRCLQKNGIIW